MSDLICHRCKLPILNDESWVPHDIVTGGNALTHISDRTCIRRLTAQLERARMPEELVALLLPCLIPGGTVYGPFKAWLDQQEQQK